MLRAYVDLSCQKGDPDAGARELFQGIPDHSRAISGGGTSPLHLASERGHVGVVRELLSAGADPKRANQEGATPLHLAARYSYPEVVVELLTSGITVDLKNPAGETPLHTAARYAKSECVADLLRLGADENAISDAGDTPVAVVGKLNERKDQTRFAVAEERVRRMLYRASAFRGCEVWEWPCYVEKEPGTESSILKSRGGLESGGDDSLVGPDTFALSSTPGDAVTRTVNLIRSKDKDPGTLQAMYSPNPLTRRVLEAVAA
ncbi:unnamed protein product [Choristocarpus tenellus]